MGTGSKLFFLNHKIANARTRFGTDKNEKKKKKEGNDLKHCDIDVIEVNVRKELARGITDSQSWS